MHSPYNCPEIIHDLERNRKGFTEKLSDRLWENSWRVGRVALVDWLWLKDITLEVCDQANEGSDAIQCQIAKNRMRLELSEQLSHRPRHCDNIVQIIDVTMAVTLSRFDKHVRRPTADGLTRRFQF